MDKEAVSARSISKDAPIVSVVGLLLSHTAVSTYGGVLAAIGGFLFSLPLEAGPHLNWPMSGLVDKVKDAFGLINITASNILQPTIAIDPQSGGGCLIDVTLDGKAYQLRLKPHSVRAENYQLVVQLPSHRYKPIAPGPELTLRGTVVDKSGGLLRGRLRH